MLPRQHTIAGDLEYVHISDDAWDVERIDAELALLSEREKADHPWVHYVLGVSRYDLPAVRSYMRPGVTPTVFVLRRLDESEWGEAQRAIRRDDVEAARVLAWRHGLVSVTGIDLPTEGAALRRGRLTDADQAKLLAYLGAGILADVGEAVLRASKSLTEDEKKRFDSSRGDIARALETRTRQSPSSTADETALEVES